MRTRNVFSACIALSVIAVSNAEAQSQADCDSARAEVEKVCSPGNFKPQLCDVAISKMNRDCGGPGAGDFGFCILFLSQIKGRKQNNKKDNYC